MTEVKSPAKSPTTKKGAKSPGSNRSRGKGHAAKTCVFCEQSKGDEDNYGKLLSSKTGLTAHYFCMLFSSGLSQNGKTEKQGILGFLPDDIFKEVRRGSRLRCSYCKKVGATIGCVVRNCKKMFHLGCGRQNGTLHQFFDTFSSFCMSHRPQQDVPTTHDPSYVCSICMTTVECKPSPDTLRAPCCRKAWYHRPCVQSYAKSAGLYFFKCPLCNNKDDFQEEMLTYGIYIPDQDASWETEPHAFQELLERYQNCDAKICRCAEGRKYDKEGSKWELLICDNCGSQGGHVECGHLIKKGKDYICPECNEVDLKCFSPGRKKLTPKRKSLEVQKETDCLSAEKQSSEYPGPSNRMRKTGLPQVVATSPDGRGLPASPEGRVHQGRKPPRNREGLPTTSPKKRKRMSVAAEQELDAKKQRIVKIPDGKSQKCSKDNTVSPKASPALTLTDDSGKVQSNAEKDSKKRLSLEDFKDGIHSRLDKKKTNKKKRSVELGGSQKTLEGWLKLGSFKPKEKSPQDLHLDNKIVPNVFKRKTPVKRPAMIEWRGVQLQIKSPRVLLKKDVDISGNIKPRSLDFNPKKERAASVSRAVSVPNIVVTTGKALLADLDNDFRVTRNMVSNVDSVRSPTVNQKSVNSKSPGTKFSGKNKGENKSRSLLSDLSGDLSEDELTPKSRESLLQSSGKKKKGLSIEKVSSLGIQVDDIDFENSDRCQSPRELRSSGKKRTAVSNSDSRDFWTLPNGKEPSTPTLDTGSDFFPMKGVLDENSNYTPGSKAKSNKKTRSQCGETPPTSSRSVPCCRNDSVERVLSDRKIETGIDTAHTRNSPVLRSSSSKQSVEPSRTSDRKQTPKLNKATRSLNDSFEDKIKGPSDYEAKENAGESVHKNLDSALKLEQSPLKSDKAEADLVTSTLQLTPKRKSDREDCPPKIRRSKKSLSELKSCKVKENSKPEIKDHAGKGTKADHTDYSNTQTVYLSTTETSSKVCSMAGKSASVKSNGSLGQSLNLKTSIKADLSAGKKLSVVSSASQGQSVTVQRGSSSVRKPSIKANSASDKLLNVKPDIHVENSFAKKQVTSAVSKTFAEYQDLDAEISFKFKTGKVKTDTFENIDNLGFKEIEDNCRAKIAALVCSPEKIDNNWNTTTNEPNRVERVQQESVEGLESKRSPGPFTKITENADVDSKPRSSPRLNRDKTKELNLVNLLGKTIEKYIGFDQQEAAVAENISNVAKHTEGQKALNSISSMANSIGKSSEGGFVQLENKMNDSCRSSTSSSKPETIKKRKRSVKSLEKSKSGSILQKHKGIMGEDKTGVEQLAGKPENNLCKDGSVCENTCPNPQPLLDKRSPRQGLTLADDLPLSLYGSTMCSQRENSNPALQEAQTCSPGLRESSYYSSLLASAVREKTKTISSSINKSNRESACTSNLKISSQTNTLLRNRLTANSGSKNELSLEALTEQMNKSANDFHTLSRSSSRSSEEYALTCPVGLSLSPSYVTKFRRSHSELMEEKQTVGRNGNIDNNNVSNDLPLLERLETSTIDLTSDKLVMSEYYSSDPKTAQGSRVENIDMDDIRPLTDIKT